MLDYLMIGLAAAAAREQNSDPSLAAIQGNADPDRQQSRAAVMELALEAMVRLCIDKGIFTEEEFIQAARKIDMEDGVMDGRRDMNKMRRMCPSCHKPNSTDRPACMWCGASIVEVLPEPLPPQ